MLLNSKLHFKSTVQLQFMITETNQQLVNYIAWLALELLDTSAVQVRIALATRAKLLII